ncbi:hypothetical protein FBU30_000268 [Linnemannia zychae]|nr:hypothetical protein FBU30_000268 [Linnemannia zychae]
MQLAQAFFLFAFMIVLMLVGSDAGGCYPCPLKPNTGGCLNSAIITCQGKGGPYSVDKGHYQVFSGYIKNIKLMFTYHFPNQHVAMTIHAAEPVEAIGDDRSYFMVDDVQDFGSEEEALGSRPTSN